MGDDAARWDVLREEGPVVMWQGAGYRVVLGASVDVDHFAEGHTPMFEITVDRDEGPATLGEPVWRRILQIGVTRDGPTRVNPVLWPKDERGLLECLLIDTCLLSLNVERQGDIVDNPDS